MISSQEAIELRLHLINELVQNGFGDVVNEINTRLQEDYIEEGFERNARSLLEFFLAQSIEILENLSNKNFLQLINRFNELLGEEKVEGLRVELLNEGVQRYFDLKDLPEYGKIIATFQEIQNEIRREN